MSRALALAVLLLAAAAVAPLASADGVKSVPIPGAKEAASGAKMFDREADAGHDPVSGLPADPAPDARP
ncbi:hypothetical protein Zm00014a_039418 [Zea mays]|jgi:hypothetical protein|uniref:Uncharacterized protein n=2 Tax=Zea mays TaxID=4577 RepID=A0A1D6I6M1_MAIZE|nr:uncharacterized protein LOC100277097 precursor [Zea mays]ONM55717.1 hypothetical protein ZEAMMB73_Zm00001d020847 [Zea mays]PWZ13722.1 hypothetical protein Zm00014a_039418 [Zea mays]